MAQQGQIGRVATTVTTDTEGVKRVTYHNTNVVTVYPCGSVVLDHGGWTTATTKTRMNQAAAQLGLGFHVRQKDGVWWVDIVDDFTVWNPKRRGMVECRGLSHKCGLSADTS